MARVAKEKYSEYRTCERCGAGFQDLYLGGTGVWKTTILCLKCHFIRRGVPYEPVMLTLIADQYDLSYNEAKEADEAAQREYVELVERNTPDSSG